MKAVIIAAIASLVFASSASAGNWGDPKLDATATAVAGHAVSVYCESSYSEWRGFENYFNNDFAGFTYGPDSGAYRQVVYVAPAECYDLHLLMNNPAEVGPWHIADALHTLIHEAVHQRGGVFDSFQSGDPFPNAFEGRTDCEALKLVPTYLIQFGIPATVSQTTSRYVPVKKRGKITGWKVISNTTQVVNPLYQAVLADDQATHDSRGQSYPAYKGNC